MIHIDMSALVPVFIREPKTAAVISWLESSGERLAISEWSLVEFASAAAIKTRTGEITSKLAQQVTPGCKNLRRKIARLPSPGETISAVPVRWWVTAS